MIDKADLDAIIPEIANRLSIKVKISSDHYGSNWKEVRVSLMLDDTEISSDYDSFNIEG